MLCRLHRSVESLNGGGDDVFIHSVLKGRGEHDYYQGLSIFLCTLTTMEAARKLNYRVFGVDDPQMEETADQGSHLSRSTTSGRAENLPGG